MAGDAAYDGPELMNSETAVGTFEVHDTSVRSGGKKSMLVQQRKSGVDADDDNGASSHDNSCYDNALLARVKPGTNYLAVSTVSRVVSFLSSNLRSSLDRFPKLIDT